MLLPIDCFGPYVDHGTLPEAGSVRDQPYLLFTVLELMKAGWNREREWQRQLEARMIAQMQGH